MSETHEEPTGRGRRPDRLSATRLRGLSHPLRVRILDLLQVHGALTASGLAELVGESSGSTSYHLRQLAKHQFVQEVEGRGTARERWWEAAPGGFSIGPEQEDDVGTRTTKSLVNAEFERSRQEKIWRLLDMMGDSAIDDSALARWKDAVTLTTSNLFATPDQLARLVEAVSAALEEQLAPLKDQEGVPGAVPVQIHFNAFPVVGASGARAGTSAPDDDRG
ncbi:helix-turn-helix domain-containing protein [Isoptericola halotolerans]|uniref:DNA-binding transcriptional ArsR family regulator n=1 Tax=Isoptericola halotolerans TaxID=300560 RepID=A0ABX2A7A9_9MICO|nr:winged helix-turn-helix domain-containing protein [Isoptericola halotolerans]NOV97468.1 DNA-binding transcriptional ArsR family regulator [Isoptericola halotolerans]